MRPHHERGARAVPDRPTRVGKAASALSRMGFARALAARSESCPGEPGVGIADGCVGKRHTGGGP
jgi:hypothetical protein